MTNETIGLECDDAPVFEPGLPQQAFISHQFFALRSHPFDFLIDCLHTRTCVYGRFGHGNPFDLRQMVFRERTPTVNEPLLTKAVSAPWHDHSSAGVSQARVVKLCSCVFRVRPKSTNMHCDSFHKKFHLTSDCIKFGNCNFGQKPSTSPVGGNTRFSGNHLTLVLGMHFFSSQLRSKLRENGVPSGDCYPDTILAFALIPPFGHISTQAC